MIFLQDYFAAFWELTIEMAPYLLLGFLIAGLLNGVFSKDWLQRKLGKPGFASSIKASLFGIPLPLCSCGVIPTGVSFHQNGASKGATTSFLISTPQTGVDSILITYALMGWAYAIARPIIAFVTGVFGGFIADNYVVTQQQTQTSNCNDGTCETCSPNDPSQHHWFNRIFKYAFVTFLQDISRYLVLGLALAALITVAVPDSLFTEYVDKDWLNMLIVLVASIPLYVCATASVPIVAALLLKGISPGAAIVFLMAGPATNIATFTVLWNTIGKKTTLVYLFSIIGGALFFGFLIDYGLPESLYQYFLPLSQISNQGHHFLPHWLMIGSGILLIYLIIQAEIIRMFTKTTENTKTIFMTTYKIKGMTCNHCVANVKKNLSNLKQVTQVHVNLDKGIAQIEGDASESQIKTTVEQIGYQYDGKVES